MVYQILNQRATHAVRESGQELLLSLDFPYDVLGGGLRTYFQMEY